MTHNIIIKIRHLNSIECRYAVSRILIVMLCGVILNAIMLCVVLPNVTQDNNKHATLSFTTCSVSSVTVMLSVAFSHCYAERRYAKCRYAERRCAAQTDGKKIEEASSGPIQYLLRTFASIH